MRSQKRKSIAMKFVEKKFIKSKTIQRNKNIFDIGQIDTYQTSEQIKRRTPFKSSHAEQISEKVSEAFMNSTTVNSFKLESQICKHKEKVGNSNVNSRNQTKYIYYMNPEANQSKNTDLKGIDMDKMLTRQYRQSLDFQDRRNEVRFNNFYFGMPDDSKTRSFEKYLSREELQKLKMQTVPDSNPQIPRIYETVAYPSTTFKVSWDYKRQKWSRGPVYFKIQKENSTNLNLIDDQKVQKGRQLSTSKWNRTLKDFRSFSSKQEKSQFQRTFYPPSMNFRPKKQRKVNSSKAIRLKDKKGYPEFERYQLCDLKYFRLFPNTRGGSMRLHTQ